jgi:transcription initiation factor TFIID subunit TAF12
VARTAVVAGTATAVSNRVSRRQANRWQQQQDAEYQQQQQQPQQQYYQEPVQYVAAVPAAPDPVAQLRELADLRAQGVLTDAEFEAQKARILAS